MITSKITIPCHKNARFLILIYVTAHFKKGWYDMGWKIRRMRRYKHYAQDDVIDEDSILYKALESYNYNSIKEIFGDDEDELSITEKADKQ